MNFAFASSMLDASYTCRNQQPLSKTTGRKKQILTALSYMTIFHDKNEARHTVAALHGTNCGVRTNHQVKNEAALAISENKLQAAEIQQKINVSRAAWRA